MAMGMERKVEQEVYEEIKIEPNMVAPLGDQDVEVAGRVVHGEQHGEPEHQDSDEGSDPDLDEPPEAADAGRRRVDPLPSVEEQRLHRVTHMPYRSWCPHCVAAAANDHPHRRVPRPEAVRLPVPEVHWDFFFPRDEHDWNVVLLGRDKETKMTVAHVVPFKGALIDWLGEQLVRDLLRFGFRDTVILKSDQEPAIARMRGEGRTIMEHSPVADSHANGFVERVIQTMEKILKTHLLALEGEGEDQRGTSHLRMAGGVQRRPVQQVSTGQRREDRDAEVEGEALYSTLRGVRAAHHVPGRWKSSRWHDERTVDVWIVPWEASRLGGEPGDDRRRQGGQSKSH